MHRLACRAIVIGGLLSSTVLASEALAQLAAPPPVRPTVDGNGVNLFDGKQYLNGPSVSMGQAAPQGLSYFKLNRGSGWSDNVIAALNKSGTTVTVSIAGTSDNFTVSGSTYTNQLGNGSTLSFNSTSKIYTYTRADGTVIRFDWNKRTDAPYYSNEGRAIDLTAPSGAKLNYSYESQIYCPNFKPGGGGYICMQTGNMWRITNVRSSYGYRLTFNYTDYEYFYDPTTPEDQPDFALWSKIVGVTADNLAIASGGATPTQSFTETLVSGYNNLQVTDPMGRVTKYRDGPGGVNGITLPGSTSEDMTIAYTTASPIRVSSVTTQAGTTNYSASDASGVRTVTVTDALSHATTYKFDIATERLTEVTDANSHTTAMQYDGNGRVTRVTQPEGNYSQLTYDARGNVTEQRAVSKTPGTPADIVTTAGYDASCSNAKTCNQPNWTKDAKGNQTDFTYDSSHGGILTATAPAPTTGAVRPQVRYSYSSLQAYYKNGSGSIVASGEPVTLLTGTSACQTTASCAGVADEVKASISYGPQTTGVGNNLLPVSTSKGAGDNSLTATTAYTYDSVGNLTYVDGPLSGTADTARALYNANRETIGSISPDPDAGGALPNRAQRITIDGKGLVTKVESGTTAGQSDSAWSAFSAVDAVDVTYDGARRPVTQKLSSGGTSYALTQTSYDGDSRVDCVATRMNTSLYGSLPSSACTLGTAGSAGPDRITKVIYDAADNPTQKQVAVGTADQATEQTLTYTANDRLQALKDAENNLTTYEYDGFDRLAKTRYPVTTKGANASSTTDYEQLGYDANSNVTSRRLRDAQSIAFTYDNLNRPTQKNLPGSEPDVSYGYDNLGRLTSASQTGNALSFTYDALSRNLTQVGPLGTVTSAWDLAGRRTRLTYPGSGLYVDYDYLTTGEMTKARENGATSGVGVLATFAYDNIGRRSSLTRGNGTVTSYGFDAVSRLSTLAENMTGTGQDQSVTFSYNPASQITSLTKTNDAYAWTGHGNGSTASVANGLNQLSSIGGTATTHDARGNVTFDPLSGKTYGYASENLLTSASGGTSATLGYDPAMRLYQVSATATTRFLYDGVNLIGEYDGSNVLQKRYVFGPGIDEPLVQYDASATRSWLHADERGSIIAISDGTGTVTQINAYDEYGKPQGTNVGRFQYTGQTWLPEIGAYYYKARIYSPVFGGRFLQTDPIGYGDGPNWYNYVGGDPVNWVDPMGTKSHFPPSVICGPAANANSACAPSSECTANWICVGVESLGDLTRNFFDNFEDELRDRLQLEIDSLAKKLGLPLFCSLGSVQFGVDAELFIGGGIKYGGGLVFNVQNGQGRLRLTGGGGAGLGASVGAGIKFSTDGLAQGLTTSIDSRISGGYKDAGGEAKYNWNTTVNGQKAAPSGVGGAISLGTGIGVPAAIVPIDVSFDGGFGNWQLDTPCDEN